MISTCKADKNIGNSFSLDRVCFGPLNFHMHYDIDIRKNRLIVNVP